MSLRIFSHFRPAQPSVPPLFSSGALKFSEQVQWLDSMGLLDPHHFLHRHLRGDWGDLDEPERSANNTALESGSQITSRYQVTSRLALVVITDKQRNFTLIQLPSETVAL